MISLGTVPAGSTVYIPFATYAGSTGASATCTGLAVTDIEIYKNGSTTQRASDAGVALLDTDGIDFDGITGLHGFSIDLNDNTDAGFFAVGSWYWVVVSAITVDSQTVTFLAAVFRIGPAEVITGYPVTDIGAISGDTDAANNCELMFDGTGYAGGTTKLVVADSSGVTTILSRVVGTIAAGTHNPQSGDAYGVVNNGTYGNSAIRTILTSTGVPLTSTERTTLAAALEAAIINELDGTAVMQAIADLIASDMTTTDLTVAAIASAVRDAILNRVLAGNHDTTGTVGKVLQDTLEDTGTTLPATLTTILIDTDELQKAITDGGRTDLLIDAIKAKTDNLPTDPADQSAVEAAIAAVQSHGDSTWATAISVTVSDKTGFKLASDGLDSVATTAPTGPATNFREMIVQTWRRFFKRSTRTYSGGTQQIVTYADNGTTPITTQTISDDGTTETQGVAS